MQVKIVVCVSMNDEKSRSKALKICVGIGGVESAALSGAEKDQVVVVGEGIDAVEVTRQLRKGVGHAELVSVGEDKKEDTKPAAVTPVVWSEPFVADLAHVPIRVPVGRRLRLVAAAMWQ